MACSTEVQELHFIVSYQVVFLVSAAKLGKQEDSKVSPTRAKSRKHGKQAVLLLEVPSTEGEPLACMKLILHFLWVPTAIHKYIVFLQR